MKELTKEEKYTEFWPGDRYADLWPLHYKAGMWMWLLHRISGLFIISYGVIHLGETLLASIPGAGPTWFDWFYREVGLHPVVQVLDIILVASLLYHGLNGLRLTVMDFFGFGVRRHRRLFWLLMAAGGILWMIVIKETLPYILQRSS
ncbi:MAG: succinate dehydrogenase, cytochrome b556 subunit [Chloroflexi bacterium]|nr:succinate dehydrogenase, cytochrome b556 subunit [Chloroflexota bacterium]